MRLAVLLALVGCCVLLSACKTLQQREDLDITLVNVRLGDATAWETTAYFTVRYINASPTPLVLNGSAHKFYLNGVYVGQGLAADPLEVPRLSSATQELAVQLRNVSLAKQVRPILESRAVEYRIQSTLYLGEGPKSDRCRVAQNGRLALDDFQPDLRSDHEAH